MRNRRTIGWVGAAVLALWAACAEAQVGRVQFNNGTPQVAPVINFTGEAGTCGPSANGPTCTVPLAGTGVFNVKAYGATGNAADTQTTALQAAADACKAAGGGTIYAPRGTYKAARWTVASKCHLRGDGIDATTFKCTDTEPNQCILIGDSATTAAAAVSMSGFTLDGRGVTRIGASLGGYVRGIGTVAGSSDLVLDGIKVTDGGRRAIEIMGANHATVARSILLGSDGDSIHFDGASPTGTCTDVKAVGNTVRGSGDVGIAADYCDGVVFTGNTIEGRTPGGGTPARTENGLDISGSSNVSVTGNVLRQIQNTCVLASGFRIAFCAGGSNSGASCTTASQCPGGSCSGTDYAPKHAVIAGNTCSQRSANLTGTCVGGGNAGALCTAQSECGGGVCAPVNHAINVLGCSTGQSVLPCGSNTYAQDITIADNHLYDTPGIAILLSTLVDGFSITGNAMRNPKWTGAAGTGDAAIQLASSGGNVITNGSITGNLIVGDPAKLGNGIFASGTGVSNVRIAANQVRGIARTADVRITAGNTSNVVTRGQNASAADLTGGGDLASAGRGSEVYCGDCLLGSIPCAGSGTGASTARKLDDDVWTCAAAPTPGATITPPFNVPLDIGTGALTTNYTNSGTGTVLNHLVRQTASGTVQQTTTAEKVHVIGICIAGCGNAGTATVAIAGRASCEFDSAAAVAIKDFVGISATTDGTCTSLGANPPTNAQVVGRAQTGGVAGGTYTVILNPDQARTTPTPAGTPQPVGAATGFAGSQPAAAPYDHIHARVPLTDADVPDGLTLDAETYSVAATVTAGTNAQGQGALTKDVNIITTASSAPSGVTLPTATTGRRVVVVNRGANTVNVYPASGGAIDGLGANTAVVLPAGFQITFRAASTTQWYSTAHDVHTMSTASPKPIATAGLGNAGTSDLPMRADAQLALPDAPITPGTYPFANVTVNQKGQVTGIQPGSISPKFKLTVDLAGTDGVGCGDPLSPCRTITGAQGANARVLANNDNMAVTCATDNGIGCMRCSGTATKCNASLPWDTDCNAGTVCSAYTCSDDSTEGCAFRCSATTAQACIADQDCPNREVCCTAAGKVDSNGVARCTAGATTYGACTSATKKCNGGTNDGATCTVDSQCPGILAYCANTCNNGPRLGLVCGFDTDCQINSCGGTAICSTLSANSACSGGFCNGPRKEYGVQVEAGWFENECFNSTGAARVPPPGGMHYSGRGKSATYIGCPTTTGIGFDLTNRWSTGVESMSVLSGNAIAWGSYGSAHATMVRDVSFVGTGVNKKQCAGGTNQGAVCTVDSQCPGGRCSQVPILNLTGRGNANTNISDTWVANYGANGQGVTYEQWPQFVCRNDVNRQCASNSTSGDADCTASTCTPRTCFHDRQKPCTVDSDCAGTCIGGTNHGAACSVLSECPSGLCGSCTTAIGEALSTLTHSGSSEIWFDNVLFQPAGSTASSGDFAALDILGRAGGTSNFNELVKDSFIYSNDGGAATSTGLRVRRDSAASGNIPSGAPSVTAIGSNQIDDVLTQPDKSIDIGSNATLIVVGTFDYDAATRNVDGNITPQFITRALSTGTAPPDPKNGECWRDSSGVVYCQVSGASVKMGVDPTIQRGDVIYRGASGLARLGIGTSGQVIGSNGTDPVWSSIALASTFVLVPPLSSSPATLPSIGFTSPAQTSTDNGSVCTAITMPVSLAVTKASVQLRTGVNNTSCGVAIYDDADAGTRRFTTGAVTAGAATGLDGGDSTGQRSGTASSYTLQAGTTYRVLVTCGGTGDESALRLVSVPAGGTAHLLANAANSGAVRTGRCNAGSSGAPPTTTGTITSAAVNMPVVMLE